MKKMQPNLFIVGFQRCGSSSLFEFLIGQRDITGSDPKETYALTDIGYDNYEASKNITNNSFDWHMFYQENNPSSRYILEGSVCNFYQEEALKYISSLEEKKLIFIVRDPIERLLSSYNYFGGTGVFLDPSITLSKFLDIAKNRDHEYDFIKYALNHGKYCDYIDTWISAVGVENVLITSVNRLHSNREEFLSELATFLKIQVSDIKMPHSNQSKPLRYKRINRFLVKSFGGSNLSKSFLGTIYKKVLSKVPDKKPSGFNEEELTFLKSYYSREYDELSSFFVEKTNT